jgi:hypothetical protein
MATRRRAFGNIRPAGKTSWQASYKVGGQRFVAPSTFPSKADASAWSANVQAGVYAQTDRAQRRPAPHPSLWRQLRLGDMGGRDVADFVTFSLVFPTVGRQTKEFRPTHAHRRRRSEDLVR